MKLGAQFFSIRTECTTHEGLYNSMKKIKDIGYEIIQISGVCDIEAEKLRAFSDEFSLPITCTHKPLDAILGDTDNLIKYHKIIGCPVIGLGSIPGDYRTSIEGARSVFVKLNEAAKKIKDAGLRFAYHNHAFEFAPIDGTNIFNVVFEEFPEIDFIQDVYWTRYAGANTLEILEKIAKAGRMTNIHYKDMKEEPQGPMCPCGEGVTDFAAITAMCKKYGIENVLVEQDNAPTLGDVFEQMKSSFVHLDPILHA